MDIDTDGNVRYEGRFCVHILGPASARLSPEKVVALRTAIARSEFARLPENCCDCGFDDDSHITLTVAEPRPSKTIAQSCGTEGGAAIVSDLAASIDSVVGIDQWVGEDLEHCVVGS